LAFSDVVIQTHAGINACGRLRDSKLLAVNLSAKIQNQ
ncbi:hypothetical protein MTO96_046616, partial [Rhipicephalus appendiculatus]